MPKGCRRDLKVKQLKEQFKSQSFKFQNLHTYNEKAVIAQTLKLYSKVDFLKNCQIMLQKKCILK